MKNLIKILSADTEFVHVDAHTNMTKMIVLFRDSAEASKMINIRRQKKGRTTYLTSCKEEFCTYLQLGLKKSAY